jgi:hypothetical protein
MGLSLFFKIIKQKCREITICYVFTNISNFVAKSTRIWEIKKVFYIQVLIHFKINRDLYCAYIIILIIIFSLYIKYIIRIIRK